MTDSPRPISVKSLEVLTIEGQGVLLSLIGRHDVRFSLHRQLSRVVITISQSALGIIAFQAETFALTGTLADGRLIKVKELQRIAAQEGGLVELRPWNCPVEIGTQSSCHSTMVSNFILTGLYEGDFTLSDNEWAIELCSGSEAEANKKASQGLKIPLEGSTLKISAEGKSRDEHERYAMDIMRLLSLACGTGITCHRWIFYWSGDQQLELWRSRSGEEIGPGQIIESWNLKQYLEKTLPAWHEMPEEEKKTLRIVIAHLNNSGTGYLDNRLFQVAQTWEYLAKRWIPEAGLSGKEKDLKTNLKSSCRQWRKDNPAADPQGLITDRVSKAFDWPILRRQIEGLGAQVGLNLLTLGIDIDHLKDARDSVAHSITLEGVSPTSGPHHELLARAQFGLQLLLLLRLNYSGLVVNHEDGWSCTKHINSFICS